MRIKPVADWKLCTKMIISYLLCIIVPLIIWGGVLYQTSRESILEERRSAAKQSAKQYNKIFDAESPFFARNAAPILHSP